MTSKTVHKSRSSGGSLVLALGCGCTDSRSVSVSNTFRASHTPTARRLLPAPCSNDALALPSPSSSYDDPRANTAASPSFSELLRQLKAVPAAVDVGRDREKERSARPSCGRASKRVEESVVVVKETVDPLGEFRRSMLHMIVEKEIVEGAELRALLRRFLVLNSPRHHGVVLRAFAEVWEEVFGDGRESTHDLFRCPQRHSRCPPRRHF